MFDFFRSREKNQKYLLGGVLMIVAASLVITLPGVGLGGASASEDTVAKIFDDPLTFREAQLNLNAAMQSQNVPPALAEVFVPQYVNQMVTERALAAQAERMGFVVTDDDVATAIQSLPIFFQNGQFVGKEAYERILSSNNLTIREFERNIRQQQLLTKLRNMVAEGVIVTPQEVEQEYRRANDQIKVEYVAVAADKLRPQIQPTPEEMQRYFSANASQFRIPEKRAFQMLVVDEARLAQSVQVGDEQLRRTYDSAGDRFRTPERSKVRHILLKTTDRPAEVQATLRKKAEDLLKQLKAGAKFDELAVKNSEDPGSASNGGDLGWIVRGQTVPDFEKAAFSVPVGQLSDIIKTEYGFHILQVYEKEQARVRPFEEVRNELSDETRRQAVSERMQSVAEQVRAALQKSPAQIDAVARQFNLAPPIAVPSAGPGDPLPEIGVAQAFDQALTATAKGQVTNVVPVQAGKRVVARVTDVFPARAAQLAEVEDQVRERVKDQKSRDLAQQRSKELADRVKAGGNLQEIAKSLGLEVRTSALFNRNGTVEGVGSASYIEEGFNKPVGSIVGPVSTADATVVARIAEKTPADVSKLADQRQSVTDSLKSRKAQERNQLFEDGLLESLKKEGKVKIYENPLSRLKQSFRG